MKQQEAAVYLLANDRYLILTHIRPDGDTIGCAAGLCHALREQGKTAYVLENAEATSLFTPYLEGLLPEAGYVPDTVVSVDIAAVSLFPEPAQQYLQRGIDLAIDHHPSQEFFAKETCLDVSAAACGEIIFQIISQFGAVSQRAALPLYLAVSTDTGCFMFGNTTSQTHRVAAALMETGISIREINKLHFNTKSYRRLTLESLIVSGMELHDSGSLAVVTLSLAMMVQAQATQEDIDNISSFVAQIEGVQIGATLRELGENEWKLSLRTTPDVLNASHVCGLLGGGGHAAASGATICAPLPQVKQQVLQAIRTIQAQKTDHP